MSYRSKTKGRIAAKKTGGGGLSKKAKGPPKTRQGASGRVAVNVYKELITLNKDGTSGINGARLKQLKSATKGKKVKVAAGGATAWAQNDSRNQVQKNVPSPAHQEAMNRQANQLAAPPPFIPQFQQPQQFPPPQQFPAQQFPGVGYGPPQVMLKNPGLDYQTNDYQSYNPSPYDNRPMQPQQSPPQHVQSDAINGLGVLSPDDFNPEIENSENQSDGSLMGFFTNLKTEEMVALACGGAGFLLFMIVIIIIVIKLKKRAIRKRKKTKDAARSAWVERNVPRQNAMGIPPPSGFRPSTIKSLPGEKTANEIARIQSRRLPEPPASFTQSGRLTTALTGATTASGTYVSEDRPSMRHKDMN